MSKVILDASIVAFMMDALIDGRLPRTVAHDLVAPWIEGDAEIESEALGGATLIHGLDLVSAGSPSLLQHAESEEEQFVTSRAELIDRCTAWLNEYYPHR